MKKLLFTLAALFMVGTAVADDYWYVQDFEVTQAQLGTSIKVNVRAHFDYAVAAGEVNFTIPEGMTLQRIQKGTDFNIMVHDATGAEWEAENVVFVQQVATQNCGWAFADEDYYQDASGNWVLYGSPKFLPGEYENQFILTIKVDAGFTGGNLVVESKPSCTYDLRPDVQVCPEGQDIFKTCVITVEGATPTLQDLTGNIVFGEVDQTDGSFDVTYDGPEEGVAVTVISMEPKRGQYNLPGYGTYTVTAKATKDGYNDLEDSADLTWNAPTPQTAQPNVTYEETEDGYLVTVTGNGTLTLVVDEEEVELDENNQYLIPYTNTPEGEEHTVVATAQVPGELVSDPKVVDIQDPGQTPKPTIVYNEDTHTVTVTGYGALNVLIEGYGEGDVITLTGEDQVVYTFELLDDDYEVTVSATAQDEGQRVSDYAVKDFIVPAKEPVTPTEVGEPLFQGYSQDGITGYGVNITPTTAGSSIKYRVLVWDPEANDGEGDWVELLGWEDYEGTENEIWYTEEGKYRVEAYAYIGDIQSDTISIEFVVTPATPTSIDEMNAGKSIAGVRYFNMAGQEMQEANGVTIVVTTYTDGTTSAVKVMK